MADQNGSRTHKSFRSEAEKRTGQQFDKAEAFNKKLKQEYEKSLSDIQKEISDFYMRYASENKVTYNEAVRLLSGIEVNRLHSDLERYMSQVDIEDQELKSELAALSYKKRIDRLEGLMARIKTQCHSLELFQQDGVKSHLESVFSDNYYETLSGIKEVMKVSTSFATLNPKLIEEALSYPWSGEMFSERIWNNRKKLVRSLKQELIQGFIQGKSVQGMANAIAKEVDGDYKNALSVVRTETAYIVSRSTVAGYQESGVVEKVQFLAVIDGDTSKICRSLNDDVIDLADAKPGVNIPPLHPNCRSTIVPYFGED